MPITVLTQPLYVSDYGIKFVTPWNTGLFDPKFFAGGIKFYPKSSKNVVLVNVEQTTREFEEENIVIYVSDHNDEKTKVMIHDKKDLIYEIAKMYYGQNFVLDLNNLQVIEREHFTSFVPLTGLNSLFIFENAIVSSYYIIMNTTENVPDRDFFAWLLSYVYSSRSSIIPRNSDLTFGKQFLQVLSQLYFMSGSRRSLHIITDKSVLNCVIGDTRREELAPGLSTDRLKELGAKAFSQMYPPKGDKQ